MSEVPRGKSPLDVLQSMVNAILIETGKALRASNKESGKSAANVNARLRRTVPGTIENFHQALDDLECDIVRAKSVLLRDLEEIRAKRKALENPAPVIEEADLSIENTDLADWAMDHPAEMQPSPKATIKQEDNQSRSPEKPPLSAPIQPESIDISKENIPMAPESSTSNIQGLTPPSSVSSKPIGLGISTENSNTETVPATTQEQDSAIEALFDTGDSDLMNFDSMDFTTQSNDHSQPQNDEFDLANFGSTSQDFNITDLHTPTQASNTNNSSMNKQEDDIFSMVNTQSVDNMDLDFDLDVVDTEFNDMFDAGNDLDHDLDSTFFES